MTSKARSSFLCGGFATVACILSVAALAVGRPEPAVGAAGVGFAAFVALVTIRSVV